jgi:two-component system, oxyanion-binding sensor
MHPTLEKTRLRLGMIPLLDAAPLVVARERGFFASHGLDVALSVEGSWATLRDKLAAGALDAAHLLAPIPLAAELGLDGIGVPMLTGLSLNLNGNTLTVSASLHAALELGDSSGPAAAGAALQRVLRTDRAQGRRKRVFAHVFPYSAHHYQLRYWLAACGMDPDHDVELVVVPPPLMVQNLRAGEIDGYCVGAPWGDVAERAGLGRQLLSGHQIWNHGPEKILGVTQAWAAAHPATHLALIASLIEAARWLDAPPHRVEAARLLHAGHYLDATPEALLAGLQAPASADAPGAGLVFHAGAAGFPWRSHAQWFLRQMQRWGQATETLDVAAVAARVYRPDLYRQAAASLGEPCPQTDHKEEGRHGQAWLLDTPGGVITMGADRFFDGRVYPA